MDNTIVSKNYSADGGDTLVIGGKLVIEDGAEVEGLSDGGSYTLPAATASKLGGVKIPSGSGLSVSSGALSLAAAAENALGGVRLAENQAATEATELADLVTAFNALLAKLKAAGIMAADA